jgi:hypothetical protein
MLVGRPLLRYGMDFMLLAVATVVCIEAGLAQLGSMP